jgi:hypothetical protein
MGARRGVVLALALALASAAPSCSLLETYPTEAERCVPGIDADLDGLRGCDDPDCDGRCPENTASACADGRDEDGDRLYDHQDPECWPFARLEVDRACLRVAGGSLRAGDTSFSQPLTQNCDYSASGIVLLDANARLVSEGRLTGAVRNMHLSIDVDVPAGRAMSIGIVPESRLEDVTLGVPSGLAIELDGTGGPARIVVGSQRASLPALRTSGRIQVEIDVQDRAPIVRVQTAIGGLVPLEPLDGVQIDRLPSDWRPTEPFRLFALASPGPEITLTQLDVTRDDHSPCGAIGRDQPSVADRVLAAVDTGSAICALMRDDDPSGPGRGLIVLRRDAAHPRELVRVDRQLLDQAIGGAALAWDPATESLRGVVALAASPSLNETEIVEYRALRALPDCTGVTLAPTGVTVPARQRPASVGYAITVARTDPPAPAVDELFSVDASLATLHTFRSPDGTNGSFAEAPAVALTERTLLERPELGARPMRLGTSRVLVYTEAMGISALVESEGRFLSPIRILAPSGVPGAFDEQNVGFGSLVFGPATPARGAPLDGLVFYGGDAVGPPLPSGYAPFQARGVGDACTPQVADIDAPLFPTDAVDVLVVTDPSSSMFAERAGLAAALPDFVRRLGTGDIDGDGLPDAPPIESMHVGFVTAPMPTVGVPFPSCAATDDGALSTRSSTMLPECPPTLPAVHTYVRGDDTAAFGLSVACAAAAAAPPCGATQPLEAALKALTPSTAPIAWPSGGPGRGDGTNAGLLRDDSVLVVLILTDSDDASAADPTLFSEDSPLYPEPGNVRPFRYPEALEPVSRYVEGLLALRSAQHGLFVFAAVAGIPPGVETESYDSILALPAMQEHVDPAMSSLLENSCTNGMVAATPPRRLVQTAAGIEAGGGYTALGSICASDYAALLGDIGTRVLSVATRQACLPALERDDAGAVPCNVEITLDPGGQCDAGLGENLLRMDGERPVCGIVQQPDEAPIGWFYDTDSRGALSCDAHAQVGFGAQLIASLPRTASARVHCTLPSPASCAPTTVAP